VEDNGNEWFVTPTFFRRMPYVVVKTNVPAKALARAVYSRLPVIILDDVTSGLDPTMVNFILTQLFSPQGHFRKSGTAVILATHNSKCGPLWQARSAAK
jgi:ABC-type ATPase involved in cell division